MCRLQVGELPRNCGKQRVHWLVAQKPQKGRALRTTANDNHNGDEDYNSDGIIIDNHNEFKLKWAKLTEKRVRINNENYLDDFDNYEEGERKRDDDEEEREDCEETGAHPGTLVTS